MSDVIQAVAEALVSPVRRKVLAYLSAGPLTAGEIAERFDISKPSMSGDLSVLSDAGLIRGERQGSHILYGLVEDSLVNKLSALVQDVCPVARPLKREARARRAAADRRAAARPKG